MLKPIKGFLGILIGSVLAGTAMKAVGGISSIPKGIRNVTQIGIGAGLIGQSISLSSKFFKWK